MNYQNFADYNNVPPTYGREPQAFYDEGSGIPQMNQNNMTIQDVYRTPFLFNQDHRRNFNTMVPIALKGIQSESELSKLFFSDQNIMRIQKMIRKAVTDATKGEFKLEVDQSSADLFIVMRATYMEYARFLPSQLVRQCKALNKKVVDSCIFGILTNIRQDYGYLKEINKPLSPIPRPVNINSKGRRVLPSVSTSLGF